MTITRNRKDRKTKLVTTRLFLLAILCGLFAAPLFAQQKLLRFQHIDPLVSFASSDILSVTQDEQGFVWFASLYGGFARYDGYGFKVYQHDPEDRNSLHTNEVHSIYADPLGGGVWAGTGDGLVWLDTKTDSLSVYRHEPGNSQSLSSSNINSVLRDKYGVLWVGTGKGLNRLNPETGAFTTYPLQFENPNPDVHTPATSVWCLYEDSVGVLWVGTQGGGLLRFDRTTDTFQRYTNNPDDPTSLPGDAIWSMTEDQNSELWVGTSRGLAHLLDKTSGKFEIFQTNSMFPERSLNNVAAVLEDRHGNIWASLGEAVIVRPVGRDAFEFFEHDPADTGSLGPGRVWTIFEDRSGVLWMPSNTISSMVPTVRAFSLFSKAIPKVDAGNLLLDSADRFWLGGSDGLHSYDLNTGQWALHQPFPGTEGTSNNLVTGAGTYEDPDGTIWVITNDRLNRFDPATRQFESVDMPPTANCMLKGSDGLIWLCLPFTGLAAYDFESGTKEVFSHDESDPTTVSFDFGYSLLEDRHGQLWYGTHSGLNLFDRSAKTARRFFTDPDDVNSLSDSAIRSMYEDTQGRLWIGTQFGLNLMDTQSFQVKRFINGKKAEDNVITSIVSFDDGVLWLATQRGIARFDPQNGQFENYSYADGLSTQFIPYLQAGKNGILYAQSFAGILQIDTRLLETKSQPPPVVLTDFRLFNQSVSVSTEHTPTLLDASIDHLDNLVLTHNDQVVSVTFSALDYHDPSRNQYQYRLDGLNTQWINTTASNRVATFTDLSPGDYTLQVRASNHDGIWNEAGTSLAITVLPPPWQTWWAYTLYAVAFLMLVTSFVQWRTRLLHIRSRELKSAVDERTQRLIKSEETVRNQADSLRDLLDLKERLFTNISHEFRTPLTLMLGPIDNALKDAKRPEVIAQLDMARRNGKRVLRLVDQLLELSRLSSEEPLTLSPQPLKPIVEVVSEAFRPYAREKGITLSVMTDENLWVNCASDAIERMLMNLVSNSLKFTPKGGRVNVILREYEDGPDSKSDQVELAVFDTGKGIPHDMQQAIFERFKRADEFGEAVPGSGIGLALVKELTDAHGGKITLKSEPGKGTVVTILLPRHRVKAGVALKSDLVSSEALNLEIDTLEQPKPLITDGSNETDVDKPQLLVIEDNRDMQAYLYQMLSGNYQVELMGDGEAGLAFALEQIPDIVVCDVMLPKKDGYQVSHELKADDRTSHIPIIMLTARSDEDSKLEGLREHVDDFLTKPFNEEELMIRIANLLAVRDIMKARYSGQLHAGGDPRSELREPERLFMERLELTLDKNHVDLEFTITQMADCMALSVRQLQRKLKALTDQQPGHYLRLYRLNRSLALLQVGKRIGDVAYSVGFGSPAHFASCFRAQYGSTPTEYQEGCLGAGVKKVDSGSSPE
jgi:signal transduction histidine kinase/DNA-binding response OmpR family regulator/streptogramin lyase